jgi:hypothetical protein
VFFLEKEPKTFRSWREDFMNKSVLLLFFKKEALALDGSVDA